MINSAIIIGFGEVGQAHFKVLRKAYPGQIFYKDIGADIYDSEGKPSSVYPEDFDLMMVATQCDPDNMQKFYDMVEGYCKEFEPTFIDILTTTPCGSAEHLQRQVGIPVCKSTIRGSHPCLDKFLLDIPKHIGGDYADDLKKYYVEAGISCVTHSKSRATELFHALNNFIYGVNILAADECSKYCREMGVDYIEFLSYRETNNSGFIKAGFPSKVSPILTPLNNNGVLGHCVTYAPTTIPHDKRGPLADMLAKYNPGKGCAIKPGH